MAFVEAEDGGCGESGRKERRDGLDMVEDFEEVREGELEAWMMAALQAGVEVEIDVLEAEGGEEDECGEDFAGAAGGEPTFDPDEDHSGEEDVGEGEGGEREGGPGSQRRFRDGDADVGGDEGESADDGGCAEQAEEDARGEVTGKAEREADDGVDVEAEAGRGDVEDDEHPKGEDGPGENGKHVDNGWRRRESRRRCRSRRWARWRRCRG